MPPESQLEPVKLMAGRICIFMKAKGLSLPPKLSAQDQVSLGTQGSSRFYIKGSPA